MMNPDSELVSETVSSRSAKDLLRAEFLGRDPYRRPDYGVRATTVSLYRFVLQSNEDGVIVVGRMLIALGVALLIAGVVVGLFERLGLGRMPGDFVYRGRNVQVWIPLGTCIVLSVVLSVVLYLLSKLHR